VLFEGVHSDDGEGVEEVAFVFLVHLAELGELVSVLSLDEFHVLDPQILSVSLVVGVQHVLEVVSTHLGCLNGALVRLHVELVELGLVEG
jgi:hypothetical protein